MLEINLNSTYFALTWNQERFHQFLEVFHILDMDPGLLIFKIPFTRYYPFRPIGPNTCDQIIIIVHLNPRSLIESNSAKSVLIEMGILSVIGNCVEAHLFSGKDDLKIDAIQESNEFFGWLDKPPFLKSRFQLIKIDSENREICGKKVKAVILITHIGTPIEVIQGLNDSQST